MRVSHRSFIQKIVPCSVIALIFILTFSNSVYAQFTYVQDQSIKVSDKDGKLLAMPWTGGINAAQFNKIDLNGDNKEDLVLFDRMANKVMTFLTVGSKYEYAPEYEALFPNEITNWLLLKDFNCDGKKDIFTGDASGMKVYQNVTSSSTSITWKPFLFYVPGAASKVVPLLTKGFTQKINLQLQYDDLPTFIDADNDGDLDIFNVRFTGNGTIEFHKNFSMERYGTCDSLDYERLTNTWGDVTQCKCDNFAFNGGECSFLGGRKNTGARTQHGGGKALLALDIDNDNDVEMLFSEAECSSIFLLKNNGDVSSPIITSAQAFPTGKVVDINIFPAAFFEDVDFDGIKDLITTPNIYKKEFLNQDLKSSTWFYKNTGSDKLPEFSFVKNNFLQEEMIDAGDNSVPAFFDEDGDGDVDLFISCNSDKSSAGTVVFYRNVGNATEPHFQLTSDDYSGLKSLNLHNIKIQFADINGNGKADLTFLATDDSESTFLFYLINTSSTGLAFSIDDLHNINVAISPVENYHFTEINHDGRIDLLVGRYTGALEYWQNVGSSSDPRFFLQNGSYLGLSTSLGRQSPACFTADLNNDGKQDMILSDQNGQLSVINDFHEAAAASMELKEIIFNPLLETYQPSLLGRAWPTTATLFNSKRPAIVVGTIRGGVHILRNEDNDLQFEDMILMVHPNPTVNNTVYITTNLSVELTITTMEGKVASNSLTLVTGMNSVNVSTLARGLYIFRFYNGIKSVYKRVVIQ